MPDQLMIQENVENVRNRFRELLAAEVFCENKNKTGTKTVELINASFIADEDAVFGTVNEEWCQRERDWYMTMSRNVNDIPGGPPKIWSMVATPEGKINSNYGWCLFSKENYNQYYHCIKQLIADKYSRRAIMIYTRPSMQVEYNTDGMSDFICTNSVQYLIRNDALFAFVNMRSSDAIFGYKGDLHWAKYIQKSVYEDLLGMYPDLTLGPVIWNSGSFHVYERHFHLIT